MTYRLLLRSAFAAPVAICMSIVLAGSVLAGNWGVPVSIATATQPMELGYESIAALNDSTVLVSYQYGNYQDVRRVYVRRSGDSGAHFTKPLLLTDHGSKPSLAGMNNTAEVAWLWDDRVMLARSTNGGQSFGAPVAISAARDRFAFVDLAHGPGGLVAAVMGSSDTGGPIKIRTSVDGGASFGPLVTVSKYGWYAGMAVGDGVIYVIYLTSGLQIRTSTDAGATWSPPHLLKRGAYGADIAAEGKQAYVVYDYFADSMVCFGIGYRETTDAGLTWTDHKRLLPKKLAAEYANVVLHEGTASVAFVPGYLDWDVCDDYAAALYMQTSDGVSWTDYELASQRRLGAWLIDIAYAGRPLVLYEDWPDENGERLVVRARGS